MPRSNREYLLRYADQSIDALEKALDRFQLLSDAYGGVYKPLDGEVLPIQNSDIDDYDSAHGKYQKYVDIQAQLLMTVLENMKLFRTKYM